MIALDAREQARVILEECHGDHAQAVLLAQVGLETCPDELRQWRLEVLQLVCSAKAEAEAARYYTYLARIANELWPWEDDEDNEAHQWDSQTLDVVAAIIREAGLCRHDYGKEVAPSHA